MPHKQKLSLCFNKTVCSTDIHKVGFGVFFSSLHYSLIPRLVVPLGLHWNLLQLLWIQSDDSCRPPWKERLRATRGESLILKTKNSTPETTARVKKKVA